jgi:hypothetical protein
VGSLGGGFYSVLEWVLLTPRRMNFDENLRKFARHFKHKAFNSVLNKENFTNVLNYCYENLDSLWRRRAQPCGHGIWSICDGSGGVCELEHCAESEWDDAGIDGAIRATFVGGESCDRNDDWKDQFFDIEQYYL